MIAPQYSFTEHPACQSRKEEQTLLRKLTTGMTQGQGRVGGWGELKAGGSWPHRPNYLMFSSLDSCTLCPPLSTSAVG